MAVLYVAFRCIDRHAADYERITIRGKSVTIEVQEGATVARLEMNRHWARLVCELARAAGAGLTFRVSQESKSQVREE